MSPWGFLLFAMAVGGPVEEQAETATTPTEVRQAEPRTGSCLSEAVHKALAHWARPAENEAQAAAREFLTLYEELAGDRCLPAGTRQFLRTKVRARLSQLAVQIQKTLPQNANPKNLSQNCHGTSSGFGNREAAKGIGIGSKTLKVPNASAMVLAQQPPRPGLRAAGANPIAVPDAGQDLVELIQKTIAPASWDVNGGLGTIAYWPSNHTLIVRQTGEVHHEVGQVLEQLERLGR